LAAEGSMMRDEIPGRGAVLFDFGGTLVDETTEVKHRKVTVSAAFLPGAVETLEHLNADGYALGLVADGRQQSYENVLGAAGLLPWFKAIISSEIAGEEKPAPEPFLLCMRMMGISTPERVVMVGNRLDRDVAGAKRLGLRAVWLRGASTYRQTVERPDEEPDAAISDLGELPAAVDAVLNSGLGKAGTPSAWPNPCGTARAFSSCYGLAARLVLLDLVRPPDTGGLCHRGCACPVCRAGDRCGDPDPRRGAMAPRSQRRPQGAQRTSRRRARFPRLLTVRQLSVR
jgi:HAD superfamily hydrolase (TIGR01549 family)